MEKGKSNLLNPVGTLITEVDIRKGTFKQFYDFLYKDENYSGMKIQSKILYTYLRDRMNYSIQRAKFLEEEGMTSAFKDDEGNIFCIASNPELELFLNCSENALINYIAELEAYGLLVKIAVKGKPNRLYVLEPSNLSETCTWDERVKKAIEQRKLKNKQKAQKRSEKYSNRKKLSYIMSNRKNESYRNSQNESDDNTEKFRLSISNLLDLNLLNNIYIYQSELDEIYTKYVSAGLIDRLKFKEIVLRLDERKNYKNFKSYLIKTIENEIEKEKANKQTEKSSDSKKGKKEIIPHWMNKPTPETSDKKFDYAEKDDEISIDERRKNVEEWLKNYTQT